MFGIGRNLIDMDYGVVWIMLSFFFELCFFVDGLRLSLSAYVVLPKSLGACGLTLGGGAVVVRGLPII